MRFDQWQPDEPGFLYVLLMSPHGRVPGTPLNLYDPDDSRWLPLNLGLQDTTLDIDSIHLSVPSPARVGRLDGGGSATVLGWIPIGVQREMTIDFAYLTLDPANRSRISSVSTSTHLEILPVSR